MKIERGWEGRIALLDKDAEEETNKLEATHREQRRALVQVHVLITYGLPKALANDTLI